MSLPLLAAALALPLAAPAQSPLPPRALDLREAYELALGRSEQLAIAGAAWREELARAEEIFSRVMPRVTLMGTETLQHVPPGVSNFFIQPNREQGWVTARQPLFSGFREFMAHRSAKDTGRAAELRLERAKQLLYQDVARAYLDLLSSQSEILIRGALVGNTRDRIKDLAEFRRVGRSRAAESLAAESQLAQNLAQLEQARARERSAQFRLAFLTGVEDARLEPKGLPKPAAAPRLDAALERARRRADVEARKLEAEAAELNVKVVSRQRWPNIWADANYYFQRPPSFTDRVKWDATITGALPLFAGGEVKAQSKQMEARLEARRQEHSAAARGAALEARSAHEDLLASAAVVDALEHAASLAERNARAQAEDYRLGQVTNIDVLGALGTLQQTRLTLDAARIDAQWARVRLEVAAGAPGGPLE